MSNVGSDSMLSLDLRGEKSITAQRFEKKKRPPFTGRSGFRLFWKSLLLSPAQLLYPPPPNEAPHTGNISEWLS